MTGPAKSGAGPTTVMVPDGDNRPRHVCTDCGFIDYRNPLVVVGAVCLWRGQVLLCRRSIEPRKGYWTIPAGYLELNESTADGARREAREEACAEIEIERLLAVYSIPRISQVQVIYVAALTDGAFAAGEETEEAALFDWDAIPRDHIAFPSVHWALDQYRETAATGDLAARANPVGATGNY